MCIQTDDTSSVLTFSPALQTDAGKLSACLSSSIGSDEIEAKITIEGEKYNFTLLLFILDFHSFHSPRYVKVWLSNKTFDFECFFEHW